MGEKYSKNLGDGVICQCVEKLVQKYAQPNDCVIGMDLSCRTTYNASYSVSKKGMLQLCTRLVNRFLSIPAVQRYLRKNMGENVYTYWCWERGNRAAVKELCMKNPADIVVFAGGELFKDYFLFYIKCFVKEYGKQGCKILFNACGVDTNNSDYVTNSFAKILSRSAVQRVTIRNLYESCASLIPSEQYIFMSDPAICAADFFKSNNQKKEAQVGLGIMAIDELDEKRNILLNFWEEIIRQLEKDNISYKLFCNGAIEDYQFACELVDYLHLEKDKLLHAPSTPEELIEQITSFDRICAFRMHSIIISYAYQIPFVGFNWDRKIIDFSKYVRQEKQIMDWENTKVTTVLERLNDYKYNSDRLNELKSQIYQEFQNEIMGV